MENARFIPPRVGFAGGRLIQNGSALTCLSTRLGKIDIHLSDMV
jgi:hypothetical protein